MQRISFRRILHYGSGFRLLLEYYCDVHRTIYIDDCRKIYTILGLSDLFFVGKWRHPLTELKR